MRGIRDNEPWLVITECDDAHSVTSYATAEEAIRDMTQSIMVPWILAKRVEIVPAQEAPDTCQPGRST